MHAVEFIATIKEGAIEVPKEYLGQLQDQFRVIILQDLPSEKAQNSKKKRSLSAVKIKTKDLKFTREEANER